MKFRKSILLLPAMVMLLVACNEKEVSSTSSSSLSSVSNSETSSPSTDSSSSTSVEIKEVLKTFSLTLEPATGTTINVETAADEDGKYEAGQTIVFNVEVEDESLALIGATVNEKTIAMINDKYEFVMPNQNATIATQTMSLGTADIVNVSDVDRESLPETVEDVHELLLASVEKESVLLTTATYDSTYESSSSNTYHFDGEVGFNDVVKINQRYYSSTNNYSVYTGEEYGLVGGVSRLYSFTQASSTGSSMDFTSSGTILKIVDDETEKVKGNEVVETEANTKVTTVGFINKLLDRTFANKTESFLNKTENDGWNFFEVSNTVDASNKFYTTNLTARYRSTYYRNTVQLTLVVDGNGFVNEANFVQNSYKSDDWDSEQFKPYDGAEVDSSKFIKVKQTRGYRKNLTKTNVEQYLLHDYDVLTSYAYDEVSTSTTYDAVDNVVGNSGTLSFKFRQRDNNPAIMVPNLGGSQEGGVFGFNANGKPVVSKTGTFHALFDNGLGEIKSVEMEAVTPEAVKIQASLVNGSKIYKDHTNTLKVELLPLGAIQDAVVTLKEDSTAQVEITNNNDGTFTIKGLVNGTGTLVATSESVEKLKVEVEFTVETMPDADVVYDFLTTKTLFGKYSGFGSHFFNFNTDGTGQYVCYEGGKGEVLTFTWSFDKENLVLTYQWDDSEAKSKYYTGGDFSNITETSLDYEFKYSGSKKNMTLTALNTRLDLKNATGEELGGYN